jgi:LysR family glycine cleavage system transcriptional activator
MQSKLPLNNLNTFTTAAEHLSFQLAAETLYVTPSAVSHQIRNLERLLGYALFERQDKRVKLTDKGEKLYSELRVPFRQIHDASRKALQQTDSNLLTLNVAPIFATGWLLPRLGDFYERYPDIRLSMIASSNIVNFKNEPIDATVRLGLGKFEGVESIKLYNRYHLAVCQPDLLTKHGGLFSPEELLKESLIGITTMPQDWPTWFKTADIDDYPERHQIIQVESSAQVVEAVQSKTTVGLIDPVFFPQDLDSGRIAMASTHLASSEYGYYLTYPEEKEPSPALMAFKDWLIEQINQDKNYKYWSSLAKGFIP